MDVNEIEAVRIFYEGNRRELYTYALNITRCGAAAEDALHATFYSLLRRGSLPRDLRPYVYRALRNTAISVLRRNGRALAEDASIYAPATDGDAFDRLARREEAESLLRSLPDDERECIVLKLLNGLTFNEIAALRRVSINTAASWYRRGLARLRAAEKEPE